MANNLRHIIDYLRGKRKGKAANRLEREAMQDSFLYEALEGYEKFQSSHAENILFLQNKIKKQEKKKNVVLQYWLAAACIAGLLGFSLFFLFPQNDQPSTNPITLAATTEIQQEEDSTSSQLAANYEKKEETTTRAFEEKKTDTPITIQANTYIAIDKSVDEIVAMDYEISEDYSAEIVAVDERISARKIEPKKRVQISGKVVENGEPVEFISVIEKGTTNGVYTNERGEFILEVDSLNSILVASSVGLKTQEITVGGRTVINVSMEPDIATLEAAVVTAYGVVKKSTYTGAATTVSSKEKHSREKEKKPTEAIPEMEEKAYKKYIEENRQQPTDSLCNKAKGKVILTFYVDSDGEAYDIEISQSLCETCDQEAIRLIEESKWQQSENKVTYTIRFRGK